MAGYLSPGFPFNPPPPPRPPPRSAWSPPLPPTQFSPISRDDTKMTSPGAIVAGVAISVGAFLLVLFFLCSLCQGFRNNRANATAAVADLAAQPPAPPRQDYWDEEEQWLRRRRGDRGGDDSRTQRAASPTAAELPSFTYNGAVKHNVTSSGDEAATCSVCLGAFQVGEMVRLLPVCLHLYHVECIDPWLEAHSTCPLCRSGIDPTIHSGLPPPGIDPTIHGGLPPPV